MERGRDVGKDPQKQIPGRKTRAIRRWVAKRRFRIADLIRVFKDNTAFKCNFSNVEGEEEVSTVCRIIFGGRQIG